SGGQLALEEEPYRLEEARMLGELLDRVAAVAQDAGVAVDVRDRTPCRGGVEERRVVRHQPELAEVGGVDRAVRNRDLNLGSGAVVPDREGLFGHGSTLLSRLGLQFERARNPLRNESKGVSTWRSIR